MTSWFVNPWLLGGLALLAAPVLLHLWQRRRFDVVEWPAMDFLFEAQTRNRRRLRLEDMLLMLLRMLAVALVVFSVARPLVRGKATQEDERLLILDDSFSMEASAGLGTTFELAKAEVRGRVEEAVARSIAVGVWRGTALGGDPVEGDAPGALRATSEGRAGVTPDDAGGWLGTVSSGAGDGAESGVAAVGTSDGGTSKGGRHQAAALLLDSVARATPVDLSLNLQAALGELQMLSSRDADETFRTLTVVSDFRRQDWLEADGRTLRGGLRASLAELGAGRVLDRLFVECVPVGRSDGENLAVVEIRLSPARPLVGASVRATVSVKNFGHRDVRRVRGWLELGTELPAGRDSPRGVSSPTVGRLSGARSPAAAGERMGNFAPLRRIPLPAFPAIAAGLTATTEVEFDFEAPGNFPLRATLEPDRLSRDNTGLATATVRRGTRVLLVDGDPGRVSDRSGGSSRRAGRRGVARFAGEAGFLATALAPRGRMPSGILPRRHIGALSRETLLDIDVVLLLNRESFTSDEATLLADFVAGGGGLGVFVGNRVTPKSFVPLVRENGESLVPATLTGALVTAGTQDGDLLHMRVDDGAHPAFAAFRGVQGSSLERVGFSRSFVVEPVAGARIVASFDDPQGTPAIVELQGALSAGADAEQDPGPGEETKPGTSRGAAGKVVLFNVSADRDWSDWPVDPSYPIAMQEWVKYLAPSGALRRTRYVGEALTWARAPGLRYEVFLPDGRVRSADREEGGSASFFDTRQAGFYCVVPAPVDPRAVVETEWLAPIWFACRRRSEESDLEPADAEALEAALRAEGVQVTFQEARAGTSVEGAANADGVWSLAGHSSIGPRSEIWRLCALGLGVILFAELLVAWWFGRRDL